MKTISKIAVLALVLLSTQAFAQNYKFGHVDMQELISLMPERDSAVVSLQKYAKEMDENMASMRQEFQKKYDEYNAKQKDWLPAVLEAKTKELQTLQQNITQFQQSAQNDYSNMQQKLFAPVVKKARDAVNKIGKEKGFIYITDISIGSLIYINETQSVNIMPMAKKDLGISADKKVFDPTAAAGASSGVK